MLPDGGTNSRMNCDQLLTPNASLTWASPFGATPTNAGVLVPTGVIGRRPPAISST